MSSSPRAFAGLVSKSNVDSAGLAIDDASDLVERQLEPIFIAPVAIAKAEDMFHRVKNAREMLGLKHILRLGQCPFIFVLIIVSDLLEDRHDLVWYWADQGPGRNRVIIV